MIRARSARRIAAAGPAVTAVVLAAALAFAQAAAAQPTTWAVMPSPNPSPSAVLNAVSCLSKSSCVAVGVQGSASEQTLIETLNGSTWSATPSPNVAGSEGDVLSSVSCARGGYCVAVGHYVNSVGYWQTLIETLSGGSWTITPSADIGNVANNLLGVSCYGSGACVAVGYSGNGTGSGGNGLDQTLIETLSGGSWSITPSPDNTVTDANDLRSVSCTSDGTCTAVGRFFTGNGASEQGMVVNASAGGQWSLASTAFQGSGSDLYGVSCISDNACESSGFQLTTTGGLQTLVEDYTQGNWNADNTPNVGSGNNSLRSVSCIGPTDCVAVGYSSGSLSQTLVQEYSGGGNWDTVASPNAGSSGDALSGVSCVSSTCIAVGNAGAQTLVEIGTGSDIAPAVTTGHATSVSSTKAKIHGSINPRGADSHYYVEYGPTRAYGKTTGPRNAGSGKVPGAVTIMLHGLKPGTTYHYRLVGQSNGGIAYGRDMKLKTKPAPSKCSLRANSNVIVSGRATATSSGAVALSVSCNARARVTVTGAVTSGKHHKLVRLTRASGSVNAGKRQTVTLTVPSSVIAALLSRGRVSLSVTLSARGKTGSARATVTGRRLSLPSRHK